MVHFFKIIIRAFIYFPLTGMLPEKNDFINLMISNFLNSFCNRYRKKPKKKPGRNKVSRSSGVLYTDVLLDIIFRSKRVDGVKFYYTSSFAS